MADVISIEESDFDLISLVTCYLLVMTWLMLFHITSNFVRDKAVKVTKQLTGSIVLDNTMLC